MSDDVLRFDRMTVRRMNGLRHGDLSVNGLSAGINVIYGPNASGKTTLADALQLVLWPEDEGARQAELEGHFVLDGTPWRVDLVHGSLSYQREGADAAPPDLPLPEEKHRYRLYLHELLEATNHSFAASILQAAVGGYDVYAARDALEFEQASTVRRRSTRDVDEAREKLQKARSKQKALWEEHRRIEELERNVEDARTAASRVHLLECVQAVHEAQRAHRKADQELQAFPEALAQMDGEEKERLHELRDELETAKRKRARAVSKMEEAEERLAENVLPEEGLSEGFVESLQDRIRRLEQAENTIRTKRQALEGARTEAEEEWTRIESGVDRDTAETLGLPDITELAHFARHHEEVRAEHKALKAFEHWFKIDSPEVIDDLQEGLRHLQHWLSTPVSGAAPRKAMRRGRGIVLALGLVSAAAGVWFGVAGSLVGWILAGFAVLLTLGYWTLSGREAGEGARPTYRRSFEQLDLPAPEAWTPRTVERHARTLMRQYAEAQVQAAKAAEWTRRRDERREIETHAADLAERASALIDDLGLDPHLDDGGLYWLIERIGRWQDATSRVSRLQGELDAAQEGVHGLLDDLDATLQPFGFDAVSGASDAKGYLEELRTAGQAFNEARQRKEHEAERHREAKKQCERCEADIEVLFTRLDLEPGDDAGLALLCERYAVYQEAWAAVQKARVAVRLAEEQLEAHPDFDPSIENREAEELARELEALRAQVEAKEEHQNQISRIRQQIEDAKSRHDLEAAHAAYRRALDVLRRERVQAYRATAGWCLAEYVREETRDRELPRVFHQAREFFLEITKGRYRLTFSDERPAFSAYDTVKERRLALEELSSGTRVQLLLAVRMAFVEHQEQGYRLPLVLDETLANSDDEKARAIIQAVQEISARGRQVFYFTAQEDEVSKWRVLQGDSEVDHRFFAIDGTPAPAAMEETPRAPRASREENLPDPRTTSHTEYGARIGVPAWNPRTSIGALHLWHVIDEVEVLHQMLRSGVACWGPLRALAESIDPGVVGISADTYRCIRARVRAIEVWGEAWLVGRGRPVDRSVLEETDAVTDTFIERVAALCEGVDGNAEALIEALHDGKVKGFRRRKTKELEAFLEASAYLDPTPVFSEEQIRARVLGAVGREIERGLIAPREIWRRCERVLAGPGAAT